MKGEISFGVVGAGGGASRGVKLIEGAEHVGMKLVALCDKWEKKLAEASKKFNVAAYVDYDKFLEHDMDAVILANFFHEHAPFAIKALEAGKHVLSETAACHTLGEGVELIRAVERTGKIYMFGENFAYSRNNQEMRRLYQEGAIGDFKLGTGAYGAHEGHGLGFVGTGLNHWRNWIPVTYYSTHAIVPVMYITDTRPVRVNGFVIPYDFKDKKRVMYGISRYDTASMIICQMDNGAFMKTLHGKIWGSGMGVSVPSLRTLGWGWRYLISGNQGYMENLPYDLNEHTKFLKVVSAPFDGERTEKIYEPEYPGEFQEPVKSGHIGRDYFADRDYFLRHYFAEAIRIGRQPYLDVYRGVDMSIVGILAYKSALNGSVSIEIPDFRKESERKKYEDDDWSPDPARTKTGQPAPSILGHIKPSNKALELARKNWKEIGYVE